MSNLKDRALRAAERFVGHRGYDIVSTAYKLQDGGQIDIVAEDGDALVFIDVNARRDTNEGFPSDSITERTRERREKAAIQWFRSEGTGYRDRPIRFDNISQVEYAHCACSSPSSMPSAARLTSPRAFLNAPLRRSALVNSAASLASCPIRSIQSNSFSPDSSPKSLGITHHS